MAVRRISVLYIVFTFISITLVFGQQNVLKKRLDIKGNEQRIEDVLITLSEKGGFSFSYNPDLLPVDSVVSVNLQNATVKEALNSLLGNNVEYRVNGNMLVILKSEYTENKIATPTATKKNYTIDGYIQNSETGAYLASTTVYDIDGLRSTTTDEYGYFSLEIPTSEPVVAIGVAGDDFEENATVVLNQDQQLTIPVIPSKGVQSVYDSTAFQKASKVNRTKIVQLVASNQGLASSGFVELKQYRLAQASFVPFVGTNLLMSGSVENKFSLNVLAGYNGASNGVEVGGLINISKFHAKGLQVAGIGNIVGSETEGLQLGGIFNNNLGTVDGVQVAGINNFVMDSLQGVQVAGINNTVFGRIDGIQVAGINNLAKQNVDGIQIAGISNVAFKDVNRFQIAGVINVGRNVAGAQIAGVVNTSYEKVDGFQAAGVINLSRRSSKLQISGVANISADTVTGAQITSVLNVGKHIKGVQIGLFNVAYSNSGTSVGLLNLFWKGYNKLEISTNEVLAYNVRAKLGTRNFYNIIGASSEGFSNSDVKSYTYGFGHVKSVGKRGNDLSFDLTATDFQVDNQFGDQLGLNFRGGIFYGYKLNPRLMIFGGPVWNHLIYDKENDSELSFLESIPPYELYSNTEGRNVNTGWIGFEFGIRVL